MSRKSHSGQRRTLIATTGCCLALVALAGGAFSALAAGKGSPTPKAGSYSGFAGVDKVSFKVSGGGAAITDLTSTFNLAVLCSVPAGTAHETFPTLTVTDGHFKGSVAIDHGGAVENLSVQGKFVSATEVTGKISGHFTIKSLPPCHGSSTFSAKRKSAR